MTEIETLLSADQLILYKLIIEANKIQTTEIKEEIQQNIQGLKNELKETQTEVKEAKQKTINLERKSRKNNIIIFGLEDHKERHLATWVLEKLNNILELNFTEDHINNIYRIGKNKKGPVIIEFISYLKKTEIFQNTEKLKKLKENNLSIANDLSREDREVHKILRRHLTRARLQNLPAQIKGNKLIINNISYTVQQLQQSAETYPDGDSDSSNCVDEELSQQSKSHSSTTGLQRYLGKEQQKPLAEASSYEKGKKKKDVYQRQKVTINTRSKNA